MRPRSSATERAEAVGLALVVGPVEAARRLGLPARTVSDWRRKAIADRDPAAIATRDAVAERLWRSVERAAEAVDRGLDDPKARLGEKATALRVLTEAHALLTGGATERVESTTVAVNVSSAELDGHRRVLADLVAASLAEGDADVVG